MSAMSEPGATSHEVQLLGEFRRRHQTATLTLLFTDLVDSTRYKQEHGDIAGADAIQGHIAEARRLLSEFPRAQEIGTQGDSFFAAFASPSEGVRFALRFQAMMASAFMGRGLRARVGLHLGEVVVTRGSDGESKSDLLGLQVDVAARICALAAGGQVLCSRPVSDNARQFLRDGASGVGSLDWPSHGPKSLKGVTEPVEVCEVRVVGAVESKDDAAVPDEVEAGTRFAIRGLSGAKVPVLILALILAGAAHHNARRPASPPKPRPVAASAKRRAVVKPPITAVVAPAPAEPIATAGSSAEPPGGLAAGLVGRPAPLRLELPKVAPPRIELPSAEVPAPVPPRVELPRVDAPPRVESPKPAVERSSKEAKAEGLAEGLLGKIRLPDAADLKARLTNDIRKALSDSVAGLARRFLPAKASLVEKAVAPPVASPVAIPRAELWSVKGDGAVPWDADSDGKDEAVISSGKTLRLLSADGRELWKRRFGDAVHVGVLAGREVAATVRYGTGFRIMFVDGRGGLVREVIVPWPSVFPGRPDRRYGVSARAVYDHDGDGRMDVALSVSSLSEGGPKGVLVVDGSTGKVLAWKPTAGFPRDVVLVDADGNGRVEPFAILDPTGAVVPLFPLDAKVDSLARRAVEEALLRKGDVWRLRLAGGAAILAVGDGFVRAYRDDRKGLAD